MQNPFTAHPREQGMGYWQHLIRAMRFGLMAWLAGSAAIIHAIFPFTFKTTFSNYVKRQATALAAEAYEREKRRKPNVK